MNTEREAAKRRAEEAIERSGKATEGPWYAHSAQKAAGEDQWVTTPSTLR